MKKFLVRTLLIVSILIFGYQNFCYADVVPIFPSIYELTALIPGLLIFIAIVIFIICAISYLALKATVKKQNTPSVNGEGSNSLNPENIEKKKNRIQMGLYLSGLAIALSCLILFYINKEEIDIFALIIPIMIIVISFIVRLLKMKKASNILLGISVVLVCLIGIWVGITNKQIQDYNNKFLNLEEFNETSIHYGYYINDVESFINAAIENNKNDRKLSIEYNDTSYTSPEELEELLSKVNKNLKYKAENIYDVNNDYIESIKLNIYVNEEVSWFISYYDRKQLRGSDVRLFIDSLVIELRERKFSSVNIIYTSNTGETTTKEYNEDNYKDLFEFRRDIRVGFSYDVNFEFITEKTLNIFITYSN